MSQSAKLHSTSVTIVKAMGMFSGVKMVMILCSIIRNKLIAWLIGPAGMGLVVLYNSIVELVATASRLSIDQSALRDIASSSREHSPRVVKTVYRWSVVLGLAGSAAMCAMSPLLSYWSFGTTERWPIFCLLSIAPFCLTIASILNIINQGLRRLSQAAKSTFVGAILGLIISVPLIIWLRIESIEWIILTYGVSGVVGALIFRARLPRVKMTTREIYHGGANFIRLGFKMTLAALVSYIANYIFILFLKNYSSTAILGMYQSGYTLINTYVSVVLTGIWAEYFPRLAAQAHSPRRMAVSASHEITVAMWVLMPFLCCFVALGGFAIQLIYSSAFLDVLPFVTIGSVGVILRAASWSVSYIILARGDGNIYILTETLSSFVGLGLNIGGYVIAGFPGLGFSYILWYGFYTVLVALICRRRYGVRLNNKSIRLAFIALTVVAAAVAAAIYLSVFVSAVIGLGALYFSWRYRFGARKSIKS